MTRTEAFATCPADSYVEYYGGEWLIVPFTPVAQPQFFTCTPNTLHTGCEHDTGYCAVAIQTRSNVN